MELSEFVADVTFTVQCGNWFDAHAGPGYSGRQNNCGSLLVQHLPGPGDQCEHPQSELSLEAGGCRAAGAAGGTRQGMAQSVCEASQEHHLYISSQRPFPVICAAAATYSIMMNFLFLLQCSKDTLECTVKNQLMSGVAQVFTACLDF